MRAAAAAIHQCQWNVVNLFSVVTDLPQLQHQVAPPGCQDSMETLQTVGFDSA